jgi:hypothetical protein
VPDPLPSLAVVIPSVNGVDDLARTLHALDLERAATPLEVVVVDRLGQALRDEVQRRFPWVTIIPVAPDLPIPQMRAEGIARTGAPAVAILEDHVLVRPGWAQAMLASLSPSTPVVAGALENAATDTVADWAAFLCEYSHVLPPLPSGTVASLPGNNTVYRRDVLTRHVDLLRGGAWEDELHRAIQADGHLLTSRPEIVADHRKHFSVGEYASQRFLYSRAYAGRRSGGGGGGGAREGGTLGRRVGLALKSLALPVVLFLRISRRVAARPGYRRKLASSLPLLALFTVVWAAGELVGYVAGGGDSLSKVR